MADGTFYIKFFAPITADSIAPMMNIVDGKIKQGYSHLGLMISSPGGDVFQGLSAYNYLHGIPLEVTTHNFGSIDSIGVVMYCAGNTRLSVPHARFMMHGASFRMSGAGSLEEDQLEQRLRALQIDLGNMARVIADTVGSTREEVIRDMKERIALYPEQAVDYGLVHEIRSELYMTGAEVYSIQMSGGAPPRPNLPRRPGTGSPGKPGGFIT